MESIKLQYSCIDDLYAVQEDVLKYPRDQILIQAFCGTPHLEKIREIRQQLITVFPDVALVGLTSTGEIYGPDLVDNTIVISFSLFTTTQVKTFIQPISDSDTLDEGGARLRAQIETVSPKVAIVFSTLEHRGKIRDDNDFIAALTKPPNDIIIAGGFTGINTDNLCVDANNSYVFTEKELLTQGSIAAALTSERLKCWTYYNDGWVPIGRKMQITKVIGNRVYSIDGKGVQEIYRLYLNQDTCTENFLQICLEFPLLFERGNIIKKNVPVYEHSDGSFEFIHCFFPDEWIQFGFCDLSLLLDEACHINDDIQKNNPEALFIYSCNARKQVFGNNIAINSRHLASIAPTVGYFSGTEYFTDKDGSHCLIQTMTILALSEETHPANSDSTAIAPPENDSNTRRTINLLRSLTHLISVTSNELEESREKLAVMARSDAMTGLFNRAYLDSQLPKELKHCQRTQTPLSFILLDIDYFKQYNDCYGHVSGDECLEQMGTIIRQNLQRSTDIGFRYGGEELGCLLPSTDLQGAMAIATNIAQTLQQQNIEHASSQVSSQLTVSMGVISCELAPSDQLDPKELVRQCDSFLYQAKTQGRNQIVSGHLQDSIDTKD